MKPENTHPSSSSPTSVNHRDQVSRESAANLIREQLNSLYHTDTNGPAATAPAPTASQPKAASTPQSTPAAQAQAAPTIDANQWKQYHSAWQSYYQKYYQQYYTGYAHQVIRQHTAKLSAQQVETQKKLAATEAAKAPKPDPKKEEVNKLRDSLLEKARTSAKKVRGSRHFVPIAAAISVVMLFSFLQYNQVIMGNVQAYISPGAIDPQNVVVDPSTDVTVGPEPKLIIPKINVNVPVVYGIGADDKSQLAAMEHGVAHWPGGDQAKSVPGQAGNTVIAGHSSNDLFESGDYKFVFSQLERLEKGDTIYANYQGKRYTYLVTRKDIVLPKGQWQNVIQATDKPMLVLVTCWPLGTAQKRLLVTAEQVSPDPSAVVPAEPSANNVQTTDGMTGTSPTIFEWLFALFGAKSSN